MAESLATVQEALGDRYRFEGELGHGGMAVVYRARDLRNPRDVAVKVFDPAFGSVVGADRFAQEIAIAAKLQHPGIVTLLDSGRVGDVLYYTMPLVGGESLRERIQREAQLGVPEALAIAREVADALSYAHEQGVVHRDIKPENILLSSGRAMVADFGIACSISTAESTRLTERGIAVGTPEYMSPEQAGASLRIDGRSDTYALACVLYEMLAGTPPFTGRTAQAILARQLQEAPPSLRVVRPTISLALQTAIERALAKVPADRFATPRDFAAALDLAVSQPVIVVKPVAPQWQRIAVATVSILVVAAAAWSIQWGSLGGGAAGVSADTTRFAILPFEHDSGVTAGLSEDHLLHDALTRWSGIEVRDPFLVRDAVGRGGGPIDSRAALRLARTLGVGRYVRGEISRIGDSLRIRAALFDAAEGQQLAEHAIKLPLHLGGAAQQFEVLADGLLFRGSRSPATDGAGASVGTLSVPARQAYGRGHVAIVSWDLAAADSAFANATAFDPDFAQAQLWLAQLRSWQGLPPSRWQSAAQRAASARSRLSLRDRQLADALVAQAEGDLPRACGLWRGLTVRDHDDFTAWFGLGNCLSRDEVVIADRSTASRWRFRSSYHEAITAFERAFLLHPSMHRSLRGRSYLSVRRLFKTSWATATREGSGLPPDTTTFAAYPEWRGDSLVFVPYPTAVILSPSWRPSEATNVAINHERRRFRDIAVAWADGFPRSADALEAVAISQELLGDPTALDTLRRARSLATTRADTARLAADEVWMRVRQVVPDDLRGLVAARALADSVLRAFPPDGAPEPLMLAGLAALLGRAGLAAAYSRQPAVAHEYAVPGPLAAAAFPLLSYAALGGPLDSVRLLERSVDEVIGRDLPAPRRRRARDAWLARAATLVFPDYRFSSGPALLPSDDFFFTAQSAFLRGDSSVAREMFRQMAIGRRSVSPAELTFDGLYPEARLLVALGEVPEAIAWIDPTLNALRAAEPYSFSSPVQAGPLVRAMALRAELAAARGDSATAARWAHAVLTLWEQADAFAAPLLTRLRRLR